MSDQIKLCDVESGFFATRDTLKEIQDWIELHPAESKIALYTVFGMTLNTMAKLIRDDAFEDVDASSVYPIDSE